MDEEIPLKPLTKSDVHRLETALMIATLLRSDLLDKIRNPEDRLTWIDSLAVAAGALARQRAGYTVPEIAEELGRSEATIRNHLQGKTEAGKLVQETYSKFIKEGVRIDIPFLEETITPGKIKELEKKLEESEDRIKELSSKIENAKKKLEEVISILS